MAPSVKLGPTGIWIHRKAFEAAEANYLSGGGIQVLKTNSQAAPVAAASTPATQQANHAGGGKKKKGKSHKKSPDTPVSPSPVQENVSTCPSKSPTPDVRVTPLTKNGTKDESGHKAKSPSPAPVKVAVKETNNLQPQVQSQKEQQQQQQPQQLQAHEEQSQTPQQSPPQQQQQLQSQPQSNQSQGKSKNSKRKKNKSQSESTSEDAIVTETKEHSNENKQSQAGEEPAVKSVVASQLQQVRAQIDQALGKAASSTSSSGPGMDAIIAENKALKATVDQLVARISKLELRVNGLEGGKGASGDAKKATPPANAKTPAKAEDDDDVDLFGSDDDEDANAARDQRLKEYAEKKAKKPGPIAKSSIVLDIKPWDDETDMAAMEKAVRSLQMDGLVWGASKLVPIAYGVKKLQIVCVIEDDKVGVDDLSEKITEFEDFVQSVDVAAFNKI